MGSVETSERFSLVDRVGVRAVDSGLAEAVREGLTRSPKSLPCRYFYDEAGSRLFEQICDLPEYYLTRAEREILVTQAEDIVAHLDEDVTLVELGSGSATKTRHVIEALLESQDALRFTPIDISRSALESSSEHLLDTFADLEILAVAAEYRQGVAALKDAKSGPELILWLGSSIGNLTRDAATRFLADLRAEMSPEDRLLVGIDLRKDRAVLEAAYDDAAGVTAAFNKNILQRINNELGANFDLDTFRHRAVYEETEGRVEMYLVSEREQTVRIAELGLSVAFAEGEPIHTENSYKYSLAEIDALAAGAGLTVDGQWFDAGRRFSLNLLSPSPAK